MHCDTRADTYQFYERRAIRRWSFNQVNCEEQRRFWRCTRQRDAWQANNVDNSYKSRDNSYTRPTRGNRIRSIAMSTITIYCTQLSSTKWCNDRDWYERQYYPWTRTTDENPTRSLLLWIAVRLRRRGFLRTKSSYRDQLHNESSLRGDAIRRSSLTMRIRILWSDTRCPPTISANTYRNDHVCYIEQEANLPIYTTEVNPGRANTISANSVTNTYNATNVDGPLADPQILQLCWPWWLSEARWKRHLTSSSDLELLPDVNNYQATMNRAILEVILRYYVDRYPFSVSRWQSGVPITSTGGQQIARLLNLEAVHTS